MEEKRILAIIPARGGSKGVPHKNIKILNGKPLIAYTIESAKQCKRIDRVIVSTEDEEIAAVGKKYGVEVPFLRPMELALDHTPGIDVILHALHWLKKEENYVPEYTLCIQCTVPFRQSSQIEEAIQMLIEKGEDSLVSICESEISPYWMKKLEKGKIFNFLDDSVFYARRQDTPKIYRLNGAISIAKTEILLQRGNWYTENTLGYIMDRKTSLDIDDMLDFRFAEFLMKEGEYEGGE